MAERGVPTLSELVERRALLEQIARDHGATNVRVCGSVARGDACSESDIDLIVDLGPDRDTLDVIELVLDLEHVLERRVDVLAVPHDAVIPATSPAASIVAAAVPILEAAETSRELPPEGWRDRRLVDELRRTITSLRSCTTGGPDDFMQNDLAVDACKQRLAEVADVCRRFSSELKTRYPQMRWRALAALPIATRHGPRGCWDLITDHLSPLERLVEAEAH
jgi:predicted nucleotidyltransferase